MCYSYRAKQTCWLINTLFRTHMYIAGKGTLIRPGIKEPVCFRLAPVPALVPGVKETFRYVFFRHFSKQAQCTGHFV